MTSILKNIAKDRADMSDDVIMTSMMVSSKAITTAYYTAAMASTTPELRAMLSSGLTQLMVGHAAITDLSIKNGWEKPYSSAAEQLHDVYAQSVVEKQ